MPDSAHDAPADILELMPRCRGCRFWVHNPSSETARYHIPSGLCTRFVIDGTFPDSAVRGYDPEIDLARVFSLQTEPDFGCVQFQRREAADGR